MTNERESVTEAPHILALCEAAHLILRPGDLYRFEAVPGCDTCQSLADASEARP